MNYEIGFWVAIGGFIVIAPIGIPCAYIVIEEFIVESEWFIKIKKEKLNKK